MADKGGLGLIIGMGKPKAADESDSGDDSKTLAMKSLMKAFKANDASGALEAYELLCDAHSDAKAAPVEGESEDDEV